MAKEYKSVNTENTDKVPKWKYVIRRLFFIIFILSLLCFIIHKVTGFGIYTVELNRAYVAVNMYGDKEFSHYENADNFPIDFVTSKANEQLNDIEDLDDSISGIYTASFYDAEIVYFGKQKLEYNEDLKAAVLHDSVFFITSVKFYPVEYNGLDRQVDYEHFKKFSLCKLSGSLILLIRKIIFWIITIITLIIVVIYRKTIILFVKKALKKKRVRVSLICIGSLCLIWCILMAIGFAPHKTYITYHFTQDEMKYADMKIEKEYIEPTIPKWHIGNDYEIDSANKAILFLVARGDYDLDSKIKFEVDDRSRPGWGYNYQLRSYYKGFAIYGMYIVVSTSVSPDEDDDVYTNYDFDEPDDYTLKDRERDLDKAFAHWSLKGNWVAFTHGGIDETVWYNVSDTNEREYRLCNITYSGSMKYVIDAWTGEIYYEASTIID